MENLPVEISEQILLNVSDARAVIALAQVNTTFYSLYKRHEKELYHKLRISKTKMTVPWVKCPGCGFYRSHQVEWYEFPEGVKHGTEICIRRNKILGKRKYRGGQLQGLQRRWSYLGRSSPKLLWEGYYERGVKNGFVRKFYEDGTLRNEMYYVDGYKHGQYQEWWHVSECKNKFVNLKVTGQYSHGQRSGEWLQLYPSQRLYKRKNYWDGLKHGPYEKWCELFCIFRRYYLIHKGEYLYGRKVGVHTYY